MPNVISSLICALCARRRLRFRTHTCDSMHDFSTFVYFCSDLDASDAKGTSGAFIALFFGLALNGNGPCSQSLLCQPSRGCRLTEREQSWCCAANQLPVWCGRSRASESPALRRGICIPHALMVLLPASCSQLVEFLLFELLHIADLRVVHFWALYQPLHPEAYQAFPLLLRCAPNRLQHLNRFENLLLFVVTTHSFPTQLLFEFLKWAYRDGSSVQKWEWY